MNIVLRMLLSGSIGMILLLVRATAGFEVAVFVGLSCVITAVACIPTKGGLYEAKDCKR